MTFLFHVIRWRDRTILRSIRAPSRAEALGLAGALRDGETVVSAADHAIGYPAAVVRALATAATPCLDCQARPCAVGSTRCSTCKPRFDAASKRARTLAAKRAHEATPARRAAKTAWQRAARAANIRVGIVRRANKRLAAAEAARAASRGEE